MGDLSTIVRNTCRAPNGAEDAATFEITTTPNPTQKRALEFRFMRGKLAFLGEELQFGDISEPQSPCAATR